MKRRAHLRVVEVVSLPAANRSIILGHIPHSLISV
jgi:hypothetical protein